MYGKLENGVLKVFNGTSLCLGGRVYVHPTVATLKKLGYKLVIETERPEERDGYYLIHEYTEDGDSIYKIWRYVEQTDEDLFDSDIESEFESESE